MRHLQHIDRFRLEEYYISSMNEGYMDQYYTEVDDSKRLKIFEGYIDKFYEEISRDEYQQMEMIEFSEMGKKNLEYILKDLNNKDGYTRNVEINSSYLVITGRFPGAYFHLEVFPLEDDWYVGMIFTKKDSDKNEFNRGLSAYYKFDQTEGLIQFMKDKNII